jgi:choline-sulfatase
MCFFEGATRVPLMIAAPGLPIGRVEAPVSTLDLAPTLGELAGLDLGEIAPWTDGVSLGPVAGGSAARGPVPMEYAAEGSQEPMVALRDGRFKLVFCESDPPLLFDLARDPHERLNLARAPEHAGTLRAMVDAARARWDLARFDQDVRASQARRRIVYGALRNGAYFPWDHQPLQRASERYMRNHMDLNVLEADQRFPREGTET